MTQFANLNKLQLCSLVGVDLFTDLNTLKEIDARSGALDAEWGLLCSFTRTDNRYLNLQQANLILAQCPACNFSLHVCGEPAIQELLDSCLEDGTMIGEFSQIMANTNLKRIQINFNSNKFSDETLTDFIKRFSKSNYQKLIFQVNKTKMPFVDKVKKLPESKSSVDFLFDASGGFGKVISEIPKPIIDEKEQFTFFCGYAGGINPDNCFEILQKIDDSFLFTEYYIDMESGIRTNDKFDLQKCHKVLQCCNKFIKEIQ